MNFQRLRRSATRPALRAGLILLCATGWERAVATDLNVSHSVSKAASESTAPSVARTVTLTGRVVLSEPVPSLKSAVQAGAPVKDAEVCSTDAIPDERLLFNPTTLRVRNALVWLRSTHELRSAARPDSDVPQETQNWMIDGCRFRPHVICLRAGQTLHLQNMDSVSHNPQDFPLTNTPGCVLLPPTTTAKPGNIQQSYQRSEPLPIRFTCAYHPWMSGYALVQDHSFMTVTDEHGRFRIDGIPPGTHKLIVWHEARGYLMRRDVSFHNNVVDVGRVELNLTADEKTTLGITN